MRIKSLVWISAFAILSGLLSIFALGRDQDRNERSRGNREAPPAVNQNFPEDNRGPENEAWRAGREHEKEWREYLRERRRDYKEWAKANREERKDFEVYRRERDKDWREYLQERRKDYIDWSRASRWDQDEFSRYRRDRGSRYGGQYEGWGRGNEPRNGVCFYMDADYRGANFCVGSNERQWNIGDRYNDRISSIRIFGRARLIVYEHENFGGTRRAYTGNVPNLEHFNDRISSFEVR